MRRADASQEEEQEESSTMGLEQFKDVDEALAFFGQGYTHTFTCCPNGWTCQ
ncbi:hypothetical protein [Rufibacter immobilis]|uniref:hypothetical protein n=1 Tax=Rufibacter immobilis TaxID=1348778 RepID=UPI0035E64EBE